MSKVGNVTKDEAENALRLKAARKGANGIHIILCEGVGMHFGTNCNNSYMCYAEAIEVAGEGE